MTTREQLLEIQQLCFELLTKIQQLTITDVKELNTSEVTTPFTMGAPLLINKAPLLQTDNIVTQNPTGAELIIANVTDINPPSGEELILE